jgi:hypothetical protein
VDGVVRGGMVVSSVGRLGRGNAKWATRRARVNGRERTRFLARPSSLLLGNDVASQMRIIVLARVSG